MASLISSAAHDVRSDRGSQPGVTPVLQNIITEQTRLTTQAEETLYDLICCATRLSSDFDELMPKATNLEAKDPVVLTEIEQFFKVTERISSINIVLQEFVSKFKQIV